MAAFSGKSGTVSAGGAVSDVTKFSADHKAEVTAFGSSSSDGWKKRVSGTEEVTGSFEAKLQDSAAEPVAVGDSVALSLDSGGMVLAGKGVIESISYEVDIETGAPVSFTATFGSDGEWTFTAASAGGGGS